MKNKLRKILLISVCCIIVLWAAAFLTDYIRCNSLQAPLFVVATDITADDGGSGTYQGLGYAVEVEKYIDDEFGPCIRSVEMKMFGKVIAASIT